MDITSIIFVSGFLQLDLKIKKFRLILKRLLKSFISPRKQQSSVADLGFSRGGGGADFQKVFENFDDLFFLRSTKLIFRALPKHGFVPILAKFFASQAKF